METDRYARLHALFVELLELAPAERAERLDHHCRDDAALRAEVERLLAAADDEPSDFLAEARIAEGRGLLEEIVRTEQGSAPGPAAHPAPPEQIGAYRIVRRLAAGGMGVVYEAWQTEPSRRVALKFVQPTQATPRRQQRFRREAEILGRLQHPGIAQIFEAGRFDLGHGEQPYYAMEFVEGADVCTWADRNRLDVRARLALVAEICDAVHHAHQVGVVHRDLKPDNVLVGADGRPRVLDFGIALAMESDAQLSTMLTEEGQILGTLGYMAPEQLAGDSSRIGPHTDVYALGVLAWTLLTGSLPVDPAGLPVTAGIQLLTTSDAPRLGAVKPALRGEVETILGKALAREPERRYASAEALASDLRRYLDHRPIAARPPSRVYLARKFVRRNRTLVGGIAATLAAIAVGVAATLVFAVRSARDAARALTSERWANASLLATVQSQLEQEDVWPAALTLRDARLSFPGETPWEIDFLQRVLPVLLPRPFVGQGPVWLDDRHVAIPSPDGDGVIVLDVVTLTETGRFLEGHRVRPVGENLPPDVGWFDTQEGVLFELEPEAGVVGRHELAWDLPGGLGVRVARRTEAGTLQVVFGDATAVFVCEEGAAPVRLALDPGFSSDRYVALPGGRRAAVLDGHHGVLRLFDTTTGEPVGEPLRGLCNSPWARAYTSLDGGLLYAYDAPHDGAAPLIAVDTDRLEIVRRYDEILIDAWSGASVSDDGRLYAQAPTRLVEVWDLASGERRLSRPIELAPGRFDVRLSPGGKRLLVRARDVAQCVLDLDPAPPAGDEPDPRVLTYRGHGRYVYDLALSPDGRLAASASVVEPEVHVWDLASGRTLRVLEKPVSQDVWGECQDQLFAFSPDGRRLLATVREGMSAPRLLEWDLLAGTVHEEVLAVTGRQSHLAWLDRFLERLGAGPSRRLGRGAYSFEEHGPIAVRLDSSLTAIRPQGQSWRPFVNRGEERALGLSPDGRRVAVSATRTVRVYDRARGVELASFPGATYAVDWSPDGRLIAAGGEDGRVRLIDGKELIELYGFPAHDDYVFALAWTPDGSRLVTASGDATVRVWDARPPDERAAQQAADAGRLAALRGLSRSELEGRFEAARTLAERGDVVRAALDL